MANSLACRPRFPMCVFSVAAIALVCVSMAATPLSAQPGIDRTFVSSLGESMNYRLWIPPGHTELGEKFPLVVNMSGRASSSPPDALIAATRTERQAAFVLNPIGLPGDPSAFTTCIDGIFCPEGTTRSLDVLAELVDALGREFQIDPERRIGFGSSQGGGGVFEAIYKKPGLLTAGLSVAGGYGLENFPAPAVDARMWVVHGNADAIVVTDASRLHVQSILDQGGDVIYQEPLGEHAPLPPGFWEDADGELYPWMFAGVRPPLAKLLYNPNDGDVSVDATFCP